MQNIKATLEYEGTGYYGFAKQPALPTIQGTVEAALKEIFKTGIKVVGAGRTDRGVHAIGQVINFNIPGWKDLENLKKAINANLPRDIRVRDILEVSADFHARYSARSREYVYSIGLKDDLPFTLNRFVYQVKANNLDLEKMQEAVGVFIGKHDFSSFCIVEELKRSYVREIQEFEVFSEKSDQYLTNSIKGRGVNLVHFRVRANAFLYKMVRTLVGALLEVGMGKRDKQGLEEILEAKDRRQAGITLPACGLCLTRVFYPAP